MFERFSEKSIKVLMFAQEEARLIGHNFIGTETILLGLIREGTGEAARILKSLGVNLKDARVEVEKIIGRGPGVVAVEIPFTPRAKRVLELSWNEARQLGHDYICTEHLLLGLVREGEGVATRVLENLGLKHTLVRGYAMTKLLIESEFGAKVAQPKGEPVSEVKVPQPKGEPVFDETEVKAHLDSMQILQEQMQKALNKGLPQGWWQQSAAVTKAKMSHSSRQELAKQQLLGLDAASVAHYHDMLEYLERDDLTVGDPELAVTIGAKDKEPKRFRISLTQLVASLPDEKREELIRLYASKTLSLMMDINGALAEQHAESERAMFGGGLSWTI